MDKMQQFVSHLGESRVTTLIIKNLLKAVQPKANWTAMIEKRNCGVLAKRYNFNSPTMPKNSQNSRGRP